jgi:hypothetical protein
MLTDVTHIVTKNDRKKVLKRLWLRGLYMLLLNQAKLY